MKKYSIPRQIWRVLYPLLIFLGIQVVIPMVAIIPYTVYLVAGEALTGIPADLRQVEQFAVDNFLFLLLLSNILNTLIFALMWRKIRKRIPQFENNRLTGVMFALILLLGVGLNYTLVSIMEMANVVQHFPSYEELAIALTGGSFLVRILALGIVAPIAEELLCRGIVLNRLLSSTSKWVAILVSSALFGLMHFNLLQGIYAFVVGIGFAVVYLRYRNMWVPVIGHIAFNLANVILVEILTVAGIEEFNLLILLLPSALVTAASIYALLRFTKVATLVEVNAPQASHEAVAASSSAE